MNPWVLPIAGATAGGFYGVRQGLNPAPDQMDGRPHPVSLGVAGATAGAAALTLGYPIGRALASPAWWAARKGALFGLNGVTNFASDLIAPAKGAKGAWHALYRLGRVKSRINFLDWAGVPNLRYGWNKDLGRAAWKLEKGSLSLGKLGRVGVIGAAAVLGYGYLRAHTAQPELEATAYPDETGQAQYAVYDSGLRERMQAMHASGDMVFGMHRGR